MKTEFDNNNPDLWQFVIKKTPTEARRLFIEEMKRKGEIKDRSLARSSVAGAFPEFPYL